MEGMILHRGGNEVSKADLDAIPIPQETDSYKPVSHYQLADRISTISRDILTDYTLVGEKYAVARQGMQMFAILTFKNESKEMGLSIAYRNSYDKSISVGLATGANCWICDNLALHGDICIMKKHTKNVWDSLEDLAISSLYKSRQNFQKVLIDAERLKGRPLTDIEAFQLMGVLYGKELISPRQITVVRDEWLKPSHEEFQPRNAWSFLNACTESLKTCPPTITMEKHLGVYQLLTEES